MTAYAYKPLGKDMPCEVKCDDDGSLPTMYIDVMPGQVKGLALGDEIEIRIVGKVRSLRVEKPDNWSTGGSISLEMMTSEVLDRKEQGFIDGILADED